MATTPRTDTIEAMFVGHIYGLFDPRNALEDECRYVGQTYQSPRERLGQHITDAKAQRENRRHVYRWIRKLLREGVSPVIEVFETFSAEKEPTLTSILDERERTWIAAGRAAGWRLTNLNDGGRGNRGHKQSEETRAKKSAATKGKPRPPFTEEHRRNMSLARIGKKQSEETIAKRSAAMTGRKATPEHRAKISESNKGRVISQETRDKISETKTGVPNPWTTENKKGVPLSEDHKAKLRESNTIAAANMSPEAKERQMAGSRTKPSEETKQKMSEAQKGTTRSEEAKAKMSERRKAWWARKRLLDGEPT